MAITIKDRLDVALPLLGDLVGDVNKRVTDEIVARDTAITAAKREFATRTELLASGDISVGDIVKTTGLISAGDGGHGVYQIVNSDPANNRAWVLGVGGLWAELKPELNHNTVRPEQFGQITGTNLTTDTATVRAALLGHPNGAEFAFENSPVYLIGDGSITGPMLGIVSTRIKFRWSSDSVVKVADSVGEYESLFGPDPGVITGAEVIDGWTFINPRIDKNSQGNPLTNTQLLDIAKGRYAITSIRTNARMKNFKVIGGHIFNEDAVVSILVVSRSYTSVGTDATLDHENVSVLGTRFDTRMNDGLADYDQSTINLMGTNVEVRNCKFYGESWALPSRTAIETHGSPCIVKDNEITKYQVGMNICSMRNLFVIDKMIDCTDNHIEVAGAGIYIWSAKHDATQPDGVGSTDMSFLRNNVHVRWRLAVSGTARLAGIAMYTLATNLRDFDSVIVDNNYIRFDREYPRWRPSYAYAIGDRFIATRNSDSAQHEFTVTSAATSGATFDGTEEARYTDQGAAVIALDKAGMDTSFAAIRFQGSSENKQKIRSLKINSNTVVDAPCSGLWINLIDAKHIELRSNGFERCGTSSIVPNSTVRHIMYIVPDMVDGFALVEDNKVITQGKGNSSAFYFRMRTGAGVIAAHNNQMFQPIDGSVATIDTGTQVIESQSGGQRLMKSATVADYGTKQLAIWPPPVIPLGGVVDRRGAGALTMLDISTTVRIDEAKALPVGTVSDVGRSFLIYNSAATDVVISPDTGAVIEGGNVTINTKKWAKFTLITASYYLSEKSA